METVLIPADSAARSRPPIPEKSDKAFISDTGLNFAVHHGPAY
jgi:hypothetical protein